MTFTQWISLCTTIVDLEPTLLMLIATRLHKSVIARRSAVRAYVLVLAGQEIIRTTY